MSRETSTYPLVSVIISAYNYGHFISQTLDSLQAQTYQDWECIVIDDGSKDDTAEVVTRYAEKDSRIKYTYQKNQGPSAARNNGLRNITGKYVQFLDADDLIEPEKFQRQVEYLEQHPEVDIVYGNVRFFITEDINERLYTKFGGDEPWMPETSGAGEHVLAALIRNNIMVINSPLIRRSAIDAVGLFDELLKGPEDWDYWIRMAAHGKRFQYENMEGTLALVRSHPSSISRNSARMNSHILLMRDKLGKTLNASELMLLNREFIARGLALAGVEGIIGGNTIAGFRQLVQAGLASARWAQKFKWTTCAGLSLIIPKRRFEKIASMFLEDSLRRIFSYKSRRLFSR